MLRESVGGKVHGVQALTGKRRRQTSPDCWDSVRFDAKVWRIFKIRRESLILSLSLRSFMGARRFRTMELNVTACKGVFFFFPLSFLFLFIFSCKGGSPPQRPVLLKIL